MSGFTLKIIATITMILDHFGMIFFPHNLPLRIIGRMAFPIYAFLLVEGFFNTKDYKKYFGRLITFAFVSEVPFDLARTLSFPDESHNNIFFTLSIGLLALKGLDYFKERGQLVLGALPVGVCLVMATLLHTDYAARGVLIIVCFYLMHEFDEISVKLLAIVAYVVLNYSFIQKYAVLALIPIYFYNGKRGKNVKYLFYAVYPVHLALFAFINYLLSRGALQTLFMF